MIDTEIKCREIRDEIREIKECFKNLKMWSAILLVDKLRMASLTFWSWCSHPCTIPSPWVWQDLWCASDQQYMAMEVCDLVWLHDCWHLLLPCWLWGSKWQCSKELLMPYRNRGQPLVNIWQKQTNKTTKETKPWSF